jgi:hypothetical protein
MTCPGISASLPDRPELSTTVVSAALAAGSLNTAILTFRPRGGVVGLVGEVVTAGPLPFFPAEGFTEALTSQSSAGQDTGAGKKVPGLSAVRHEGVIAQTRRLSRVKIPGGQASH